MDVVARFIGLKGNFRMKPILHIVKNCNDAQAIRMIENQSRDNAYGVTAVFVQNGTSPPPLIPNVRVCVLKGDAADKDSLPGAAKDPIEIIDYNDLLNLIFSVESIAVW